MKNSKVNDEYDYFGYQAPGLPLIGIPLDSITKTEFVEIEKALHGDGLSAEQQAFLKKMHLSEESLRHYLPEEKDKVELTTHLYANDHLGTPMALLTAEGEIQWERQQDAFGNTLQETNEHNLYQPIRFEGQHYDEESGLYYNRHRYYDPRQGKYISQDPIGLAGGINNYIYPLNPNQMLDPLGLQACFKKRPLDGVPWIPLASNNPLDDYFNTEISREQLFFSENTNIGFFGDGKMRADDPKLLDNYRDNTGECFDDEELMLQAVENVGPLKEYKLFGSNCQTWAEKVRKEYKRLENENKKK